MKKLVLYKIIALTVCSWLLPHAKLKGQVNLILNPGFENFNSCPDNQGQLYRAAGWDSGRLSPDYFNSCSSSPDASIPTNNFGYQAPANGSAYAGFCTYNSVSQNYREYILGSLSSTLIIGQKYFVSLKVNRADANSLMGYSTNKIGLKFSKVQLTNVSISNSSTVAWNNTISDTINWIKLFGSFVSDSAYKYVLIGNFFDDFNCSQLNHGTGSLAYYFVDEICLSQDSIYAQNYVTSTEEYMLNKYDQMYIYLDIINRNIVVKKKANASEVISLHDVFGCLLNSWRSERDEILIPYDGLQQSIYIVKVGNRTKKIVLNPK